MDSRKIEFLFFFFFAVLAWAIIPNPINLTIFDGYLYLPSWRIFLIVCSLPSAITFLGLLFCVESPKFLMSQKRNEEAMRAFKKIYSVNTGNSPDEYPVRKAKKNPPFPLPRQRYKFLNLKFCLSLQVKFLQNSAADSDESTEKNLSFKENLCAGLKQMASLFEKPYLWLTLLPCTMQFFTLLWYENLKFKFENLNKLFLSNSDASCIIYVTHSKTCVIIISIVSETEVNEPHSGYLCIF